ncbi:MAG: sodium-dependent transporter [Candidatus Kapabacteria bacterium]|nr:sodium-dependent transporter [Ignavibacteriota bacterium]MCW5883514.1 sodium-dependent transporter [Candidatus Kapabacteria bacterium]
MSQIMQRERWGTRIGLVLAMAGNAVGLGNFLRFPVQAAQNGGGAFMIPYFVAFLLLAIPLMWIEWATGRLGGKHNHGSLPGMFDVMWNHPFAKYLGVSGLFVSTIVMIYYCYIESWTLGFAYFSLTKEYFQYDSLSSMASFLNSYQGVETGHFDGIGVAYLFLIITICANFYVLYHGIKGGVEKFAKIAMPLLLLFGIFLAVYVFTIGTPDPSVPENNVWVGFAFIWNPDFSALSDAKIWLAAAGQVFFTLSVGMGTLQAYASYLRENDDIALSGLSTASINEFVEVVLGGSIAIPIAVAFFGLTAATSIAQSGAFNLGFVSMSVVFQNLPFGNFLGFIWFFLLFFAGITSSVAMAQPIISFLKEQFGFTHKKAVIVIGICIFVCVQFVVLFLKFGFLDELDYWAGTFGLVIVALSEVIVFAWIYGMDKGWEEINKGADIKIPRIVYYVIKYVSPLYIGFILVYWTIEDAIPILLMEKVPVENVPYLWGARLMMIALYAGFTWLVYKAWKLNKHKFTYHTQG